MRSTLLIIPSFALLVGCAAYVEKGPRVRSASVEGDYEMVSRVAAASAEDQPNDALVWKLEEGSALRAQGDLKASIKIFEEVEDRLRAEESRPDFSLAGEGLAAFSNNYAQAYRAKPYDRIYASTYQVLNHLESGNSAAARVSVNRLRFVQETFGSGLLYQKDIKSEKYDLDKATKDSRTQEGLSIIQEELDGLTPGAAYDDAFSHWLQGLYFFRMGDGAGDRERARKEFTAAHALIKSCPAIEADLTECEAVLAGGSPTQRVVYVISETGICPEWREQRVDIPLFVVAMRVPYVSVALPALRPVGYDYKLRVQLEGKPVALALASRTEGLIAKHFEAALPGIKARAFTSAAVKATASYILNKSAETSANRQNSGSGAALFALATKIGTAVYTVGTTKADLRNWGGLPARFSLARVGAAVGAPLTIPGHPELSLALPEGKVLLVSIKSTGENKPITLRCTTLVP